MSERLLGTKGTTRGELLLALLLQAKAAGCRCSPIFEWKENKRELCVTVVHRKLECLNMRRPAPRS